MDMNKIIFLGLLIGLNVHAECLKREKDTLADAMGLPNEICLEEANLSVENDCKLSLKINGEAKQFKCSTKEIRGERFADAVIFSQGTNGDGCETLNLVQITFTQNLKSGTVDVYGIAEYANDSCHSRVQRSVLKFR